MIGSAPRATRRPARIDPPRIKANSAPTQIGEESGIRVRVETSPPSASASTSTAAWRRTRSGTRTDAAVGRRTDDALSRPRGDPAVMAALRSCRARPAHVRSLGRCRSPASATSCRLALGWVECSVPPSWRPLGQRRAERASLSTPTPNQPRRRRPTPQVPAPAVRRKEPATRTRVETAREQRESAPAAQRSVEAQAPQQAKGLGRAASRVPEEGGRHPATEAGRVGRRRRPRRPECRDGRTEPRVRRRLSAPDLRSALPPRRSLPFGHAAFRGA